jgi:PAS domain S-box-containing protein
MGIKKTGNLTAAELRLQAEEQLQLKTDESDIPSTTLTGKRLAHELEVHQIELELQNAELIQARDEVETALERFTNLYDFAPVGYCTLNHEGVIQAANLTAAGLLGIERSRLLGRRFGQFLADETRQHFNVFLGKVFANQGKETHEVELLRAGKQPLFVLIEAVADTSGHDCSMAIIDITERKNADKKIKHLASFPQLNPNPVIETDLNSQIVYYNAATLKVLTELGLPEDVNPFLPRDLNQIIKTLDQGSDGQYFSREVAINEKVFTESIFLSAQLKVVRIYAQDTTTRKRAEDALQKAHDNLETTVHERTSDLLKANKQLLQEIEERKKAEESLQSSFDEIKNLKNRLRDENIYLQEEVAQLFNFGEVIGQSAALSRVFTQVEQVAPMNATVLLLGETGTGKGVVARAIHSRSSRKGRALITVNCTTLPASLVESELFGRERSAFTGSDARQVGRFELADGGTIFLDEIGEIPMELQSKLLRVIQDGEFERLGNPRTIKTDVRIIAASNRNLAEEVKKGTFREDLYYRLNVFPISMPPLRERKDDIPLLVNHFIAKFNKKIGKKIETVSKDTLNILHEYHWPGNVRELESIIERAVIISQGTALQMLDRFEMNRKTEEPAVQEVKALVELEHDHILQVLQKTGWRIEGKNGAAVLLGLNASTLRARMRKYGIFRK